MNYSQKVLFDDWISRCPIEGVFVDEPVSQVQMDDGRVGYLVKVFLTIDKEDWEQKPDSSWKISENFCPLRIACEVNEKSFRYNSNPQFTKFFNSNSYDTTKQNF